MEKTAPEKGTPSLQGNKLSGWKLDKLEFVFASVRFEWCTSTNAVVDYRRVLWRNMSVPLARNSGLQ